MNIGLAVGGALASALSFAISSVLQHRGAAQAPEGSGLHLGLLARLMARPLWLLGMLAAAGTVIFQVVALASGPLVLVQPLLSTGLLFALPVSVLLERRRPSRVEWAWAVLLVVGLAVFLLAASPGAGPPLPDDTRLVMIAVAGAALGVTAVGVGYGPGRRHRAALLGFAAGIGYGLSAALMKYSVALSQDGAEALLTSWPGYTLLVLGTANDHPQPGRLPSGSSRWRATGHHHHGLDRRHLRLGRCLPRRDQHHCPRYRVPSPRILHHGAGHWCTRQTGIGPRPPFAGHDSA